MLKRKILDELDSFKKELNTIDKSEENTTFIIDELKGKIEAKESEIEGVTDEISQFEQQKKILLHSLNRSCPN